MSAGCWRLSPPGWGPAISARAGRRRPPPSAGRPGRTGGGRRAAPSRPLPLSLPLALGAARAELQVMAFGVVVFTLLVQGSTMGWLGRELGLGERRGVQL